MEEVNKTGQDTANQLANKLADDLEFAGFQNVVADGPTVDFHYHGKPYHARPAFSSADISRLARETVARFAAQVRQKGFNGELYQAVESLMDEIDDSGDDPAVDDLESCLLPIIASVFAGYKPTAETALPKCGK